MICTTIHRKKDLKRLAELEMAEIRLDLLNLSLDEIDEVFLSDTPLIATCRADVDDYESARRSFTLLERAILAGANYVDIEIEMPKAVSKDIEHIAHENGTSVIRSYHNLDCTPSFEELKEVAQRCRRHGGDIVKIAVQGYSQEDFDKVAKLYEVFDEGTLVAFCTGEQATATRVDALRMGAPFTYAAIDEEAAISGQLPQNSLAGDIYTTSFISTDEPIRMPASKSFAQRAIVVAALAEGTSVLSHYTPCEDCQAALSVAQALGARVQKIGDELIITGIAAEPGCLNLQSLNVSESGLLARLMMGLLPTLCSGEVTINGSGTLEARQLLGSKEMLGCFGVKANSETVPITLSGTPQTGHKTISGRHSSQLISGLLMSLPLLKGNTTMVVEDPKSIPYMFITLDVMKAFGVRLKNELSGGQDFIDSEGNWDLCTEIEFSIYGDKRYKSAKIDLEGDWSAAANFLVAGAIAGKATIEGVDTSSLQADLSIMDILMDAGAAMSQTDGSKGTITVQRAPLTAFDVDANNCPDLFLIISVLAAFCAGKSHLKGVKRLEHKESDRAEAIVSMLRNFGVEVEVEDDEMTITGHSLAYRSLNGMMLHGGRFSSHKDHRIAMALKVAGLCTDSPVVIDDTECTKKSYPGFIGDFNKIRK
ncbi:MAG: 3-phosphoshikimate 1-carboxyvinyltransferase [Bacteroidales bacterium]|nr:3-phosphoshikimate 1-carboxyvinyltransferase [Bacteroidales bacterium]